ncbi:NtaA/DmoA family FMN-dependent monooxygenase [Gulosibacter sp. 10]|uniref:NtaA/DmoA family FMN-dependent monooxygenase n=1 Tax=Gulosibacter sp. 10 TaxID=1255570 RepID=UPI001C3DF735|nr:NtaA/DmoA family FMN-dependent monooxygenase [Gulosibacter sp. 10]
MNGFKASMTTHTTAGLWRHPESQATRYDELEFWIDRARTLERYGFDGLFIADSFGVPDVYHGSAEQAVREGLQVPSTDPSLMISAMAAATKRLGFGITFPTTATLPYDIARKLSTLDQLSGGRIGWNIVTGLSSNAVRALGTGGELDHDERYDRADEFLEVAYRLWEDCWDDDAVLLDRVNGDYADPERVRPISFEGDHFRVHGIHMSAPTPQRTPLLLQAGSSERGREFAARHAEVVFASAPTPTILRRTVDDLRRRASLHGRDPRSLKVLSILTVVTGLDDAAAQERYEHYRSYASAEGNLARFAATVGIDIGVLDFDEPLEYSQAPGIRTILENFTRADPHRVWTPREIADHMAVSSFGPLLVGGPEHVADEIERWSREADIDGFNLVDVVPGRSFEEFGDYVLPELARRGVWERPVSGTWRSQLFGSGHDRLSDDHPGSPRHRRMRDT